MSQVRLGSLGNGSRQSVVWMVFLPRWGGVEERRGYHYAGIAKARLPGKVEVEVDVKVGWELEAKVGEGGGGGHVHVFFPPQSLFRTIHSCSVLVLVSVLFVNYQVASMDPGVCSAEYIPTIDLRTRRGLSSNSAIPVAVLFLLILTIPYNFIMFVAF